MQRYKQTTTVTMCILSDAYGKDYLCSKTMSEFCIYLKMLSDLRQWFIHRQGGTAPVTLRRGSIESKMLQRATVPLPPSAIPARRLEGEVAIQIPYSKSHVSIR